MLAVSLESLKNGGQVLCLGAHCDDVEIGCGATLVDLCQRYPGITIHAIVFCSDDQREAETRRCMSQLLGDTVNVMLNFANFRDGYLPYMAADVKDFLVATSRGIKPDLVFTHSRQDLHQDHKLVGEITYQVFRDNLIFEMEIPKYDGDIGQRNIYYPVSEKAVDQKNRSLMESYVSQRGKDWFREETFMSLMRLRGIECRSATGLAEAFQVFKLVLE